MEGGREREEGGDEKEKFSFFNEMPYSRKNLERNFFFGGDIGLRKVILHLWAPRYPPGRGAMCLIERERFDVQYDKWWLRAQAG